MGNSGIVYSIVIDPLNPNTIYVGGADIGVVKTTDAGEHWTRSLTLEKSNWVFSLAIHPHNPDLLFAAGGGYGVFYTSNAGSTWKNISDGLPDGGAVRVVAIHPEKPDRVYAGIGWGCKGLYARHLPITGVKKGDKNHLFSKEFRLYQNFPNPFNSTTSISYYLSEPSYVFIKVYNLRGELVCILEDVRRTSGNHTVLWDGRNTEGWEVSSGIYLYSIITNEMVKIRKMIMIK